MCLRVKQGCKRVLILMGLGFEALVGAPRIHRFGSEGLGQGFMGCLNRLILEQSFAKFVWVCVLGIIRHVRGFAVE